MVSAVDLLPRVRSGRDDLMIQQILRQDVSVTREHYIKTVPEQSVCNDQAGSRIVR